MSGPDDTTGAGRRDDDDIGRLLRASGARREPSSEQRARIHAALLTTFAQLPEAGVAAGEPTDPVARAARPAVVGLRSGPLADRGNHHGNLPGNFPGYLPGKARPLRFAIAAGLLVALTAGLMGRLQPAMQRAMGPSPAIARVSFTNGASWVDDRPAQTDLALRSRAQVRTAADANLELRLVNGALLRLAGDTRVVLTRPDRIELQTGRLYVDANVPTAAIQVVTDQGTVTDLGTQFEVEVAPTALTVLVRDGRVVLESKRTRLTAGARAGIGEALRIDSSGNVARRPLAANDEHWQWLSGARPPYVLERGTLHDFLAWSAAESGLTLRYQTEAVRQAAVQTHTSGNIDGMKMETAIDSVLATTRLRRKPAARNELLIEFADGD